MQMGFGRGIFVFFRLSQDLISVDYVAFSWITSEGILCVLGDISALEAVQSLPMTIQPSVHWCHQVHI